MRFVKQGFTLVELLVVIAIIGTTYREVNFNSWQEGKNGAAGAPSYAIITSRSYYSGIVNATRADGSVSTISENIDLAVWRAMAARAGGEVVQLPE